MTNESAPAPKQLDAASRRRLAAIVRRAEQLLAAGADASPDSRAEVHIVLVRHGEILTRQSRVTSTEYPE